MPDTDEKVSDAVQKRKIKVLESKKQMLYLRMQKLYDYIKDLNNQKIVSYFRTGMNSLEATRTQLGDIVEEINLLNLELNPNYTLSYQTLETVDTLYCHIMEAFKKLESKSDNTELPLSGHQYNAASDITVSKQKPKLPTMELVDFSGDPKLWPVFYQNFKSCVHENPDLDNTCKVHYLLSKLSGRALTLCSGVAPIASNYDHIWKILVETFQDERLLANTYLRSILDFKPLHNESAHNLNMFLEKFDVSVSALKQLNLDDLADFLLVSLALTRLDNNTQRLFEMTLSNNKIPTYEGLISFVKNQAKVLSRTTQNSNQNLAKNSQKSSKLTYTYASTSSSLSTGCPFSCPVCSIENHYVNKCPKFLRLNPIERYKTAREKFLCLNCLSPKHKIVACKSTNSCRYCQSRHNSLIHFESSTKNLASNPKSSATTDNDNNEKTLNYFVTSRPQKQVVTLLPTAEVFVSSPGNKFQKIRVLLDSGSQENFLTIKCCQSLGISICHKNVTVLGIGTSNQTVRGIAQDIKLMSRFDQRVKFEFDALVLEKLTTSLPTCVISNANIEFLAGIPLADGRFIECAEIDGILGSSIFGQILRANIIRDHFSSLIAIETSLGYVVMGKIQQTFLNTIDNNKVNAFCSVVDSSLEKLVQNFFELEDVPAVRHHSDEDIACESYFKSTYSRKSSGRYMVSLPFKRDPKDLGDSFTVALKRFLSLEKKLSVSASWRQQYNENIQNYLVQGHLNRVGKIIDLQKENFECYFIPHHAVLKSSSVSTPLRIVFDASAKTLNSSLSLNDCLFTGPKLQKDIVQVFINFRLFLIAMIADICQMYRQIELAPEHRKFQRILWRFSPDLAIEIFEITTVAFGVKPSPYLALRVVEQLARDEENIFPVASKIVQRDMYIDDLVTSCSNLESAKMIFSDVVALFRSGGFDISKWHTNSDELLSFIPEEKLSLAASSLEHEFLKVLGIKWNPESDRLSFNFGSFSANNNYVSPYYTKRIILGKISSIFDPLGIFGPVVLYAKLFIRKLWSLKLGWDSTPPEILVNRWIQFETDLVKLEQISIPRWLGVSENSPVSLIGFSDASQHSFGAVVYMRVRRENEDFVNLICSKSKVAPLKVVSIPRLELCAALLLSKLLNYVHSFISSRCVIENIFACTDSQIVLGWLTESPHYWKTFIANRVSKIHSNLPSNNWFFVPGIKNAADIISRAVSPSIFLEHSESWLHGPPWLKLEVQDWPLQSLGSINKPEDLPERQIVSLVVAEKSTMDVFQTFIVKFSSYTRLLRSMVFVLRFVKLLPRYEEITVNDLDEAERYLIRTIQNFHFQDLIIALDRQTDIPANYRKLCPFLDENRIIRVGGRLMNAQLGFDYQHQCLLPKKDHFVTILVDHCHRTNFHTGPHLLFSLLRNKYWIVSARNLVRQRVRCCNFCFKFKPRPNYPLMAHLPQPRVTPQVKAFIDTGVDYTGYFNITLTRHRGVKTQKAYVCLFICLATKNVHLELASDLSTNTFLDALKRFLSRRGPVKTLYSDNGTNFIGCKRYLDELTEFIISSSYTDSLKHELLKNGISWKFNCPLASHMGGIWESNIKSMKNHLYKAIGSQILSFEEFSTVLTQIEALLNSRPLCYFNNNDPCDPQMLTPAHFTLNTLHSLPAADVLGDNIGRLDRKQLLDRVVQSYWNRWKEEYLHQLQVRSKWNTKTNPVKIGIVVVVMNENMPPLTWPLGIIDEVFPGRDGIIRIASVKTRFGLYKRPVTKLCPLPTQ